MYEVTNPLQRGRETVKLSIYYCSPDEGSKLTVVAYIRRVGCFPSGELSTERVAELRGRHRCSNIWPPAEWQWGVAVGGRLQFGSISPADAPSTERFPELHKLSMGEAHRTIYSVCLVIHGQLLDIRALPSDSFVDCRKGEWPQNRRTIIDLVRPWHIAERLIYLPIDTGGCIRQDSACVTVSSPCQSSRGSATAVKLLVNWESRVYVKVHARSPLTRSFRYWKKPRAAKR